MPAIRALAVVLTAWFLVVLAPPGPASAGGPTSALLSVPGEGQDRLALLHRGRLRASSPTWSAPRRRRHGGPVREDHATGPGSR